MDKVLRPEGLETDSNSERMTSLETINLRKIVAVVPREGLDKVEVLANFVSPAIFQNMTQALEYYKLFLWSGEKRCLPVIFLPHGASSLILTLDEYLQTLSLETLSKDCNFQSVTAAQYR